MKQDDLRKNLWTLHGFLGAKDTEKVLTESTEEWFKEIDDLIIDFADKREEKKGV